MYRVKAVPFALESAYIKKFYQSTVYIVNSLLPTDIPTSQNGKPYW